MLRRVIDGLARWLPRRRRPRSVAGVPSRSAAWPVPPADAETAFLMIGCQRSGTHLLRELLNSNPQVAVLAEPFSPHDGRLAWQPFVHGLPPDRYPPATAADAGPVLDEYLDLVRHTKRRQPDRFGKWKPRLKTVGLDVKYNQLRFVAPVFSDLDGPPLLLDYASRRGIGVVHLVRRNVFETAVSMIIANARKYWQNYDGRSIDRRYHVPPNELLFFMRWIVNSRTVFQGLAQGLTIHECCYEDIVADLARIDASGRFPTDTVALRPLADFLRVPNDFHFQGQLHKAIDKPYEQVIENYAEILEVVTDSEFAAFAPGIGPR